MDEENQGFAIPANKPMFDEGDVSIEARPLPESDMFMVFPNDIGDKAVILTPVETLGNEIIERHGRPELKTYAQTIMDGGDDDMGLQIGGIFEGEAAEADAKAEAFRLDDEYNPGEGASDEEIIAALDNARADTTVEEENELAAAEETFPELTGELGSDEGINPPEPEADEEDMGEEPLDIGNEPMLDQLKKRIK